MNKKMLTLTAAAVLSTSAAFAADVRMFGHAHLDLRANAPDSYGTVNSNDSTLGFRVSADFSDFKAYFKHTFLVDGFDGDSLLGENDASYFNIYGDFGSVRVGHQPTSASLAYLFTGNNHLPDSIADFSNVGFTEYEQTKAFVYELPVYSGFTLALGVNANGDTTEKLFSSPSIGLMYDEGHGLKLGFGYEVIDDRGLDLIAQYLNQVEGLNVGPQASNSKMLQLGGSYEFDNIMVGAQFEQTQNLLVAESVASSRYGIIPQDGVDRTSFGVSGKLTFGNNALSVNLGTEKIEDDAGNEANNHFASIALNHTINKRVNTYIAFRNKHGDVADLQTILKNGVTSQEIENLIRQRAVAIGMQYKF